jgi:hypothetical protein
VADVEEPGSGPHCLVLLDDARVLDGHLPSGEIDEFGSVETMLLDQRSVLHDEGRMVRSETE